MGVDALIEYSCTPKQTLGPEELIRLIKARNQTQLVLEMSRRDGDAPAGRSRVVAGLVARCTGHRASVAGAARCCADDGGDDCF